LSCRFWGALLAGVAWLGSPPAQAQPADAIKMIAQWNASNTTCRNPAATAVEAIGACEQRDVYSKLLAQMNQCYGPTGADGPPTWSSCDPAKAAQSAEHARTTAQFARRGGVFVLPVTLNGSAKSFFVVDSGATNVQIPQDVADELMKNGTLTQADFVGQRNFVVADGRHLNQKIVRLRSVQVGDRTMENVLAAVGAPRSQALLGQSVLRRLNWWKIDNVKNAIELEFTGAF
jgi:clan AA aspartic protease (TIGR02281 family)